MSTVPANAPPSNAPARLVEKVLSTYVQVFLSLLLVGTAINASTAQIAAMAAIPAALTVAMNATPLVIAGLPFYTDLAYRALRTFIASFVGYLIALPVFRLDRGVVAGAAAVALPVALSVIKGALASRVGDDTPALLPARTV